MKTKRFLSILLSLVLVLGMLPGMSLTAYAEGNTTTITPGTDDAKTGTGQMTITLKIKAAQTINAPDVNATYGDTDKSVIASVTTPATGGGAISYTVKDGSGDYIDVASDGKLTIKKVPASGKAYVIVKAAATDDYAETTKEVTVNISTKAMTVSAPDVTVTVDGQPHGITVNVTDPATGATVKYGTEEGTYNLDASPTQTEVGEKTVYYQVTAANYTTYTGSAKVTVSAKQTQTITAADVTAIYGDTGKKIEASTTAGGGTLSYAVKSGDAVTVNETTGALTIVKAGSAVITVTAAETDTYAKATKDVNVTVNTKAMTVSAEDVNVTVDGQPHGITVTVTEPASGATVKYGTTEGTYDQTSSPTQTEAGSKTVYYQVTAANYTTYTGSAKVTVSAKQTQTITASDVTVTYGDTDKKVTATTNGDGGISYAVKEGSADYIDVNASTGALTIKKVGTATVIVTAAETATYTQATTEVTVTINKANAVAATVTANNRTYDGTEKPLVTVTGEPTGGTMQYALGDANGATQPYTTSIPTKTNAGTYYVWYKVVGDANHTDSDADCVTVTFSNPAHTHTWSDWEISKPATCVAKGEKKRSCSECKQEETQPIDIDPNNHTGETEIKDAKDATETEDGYTGDTYCKDCGKKIKDGKVIPATGKTDPEPEPAGDKEQTAPAAPTIESTSANSITVKAKSGEEYSLDGKTWQAANTFNGLKANTSYKVYARKAAKEGYKASPASKPTTVKTKAEAKKTDINSGLRISEKGGNVTVKVGEVTDADSYVVYFRYCGTRTKNAVKTVKGAKNTTISFNKFKGKKIDTKSSYTVWVEAKKGSKTLKKSLEVHCSGSANKEETNTKALSAKGVTLKKGKTTALKVTVKKENAKKKLHKSSDVPQLRYTSSNKAIATVNNKGQVKGVKKGTCTIKVVALNGVSTTVKVTVK